MDDDKPAPRSGLRSLARDQDGLFTLDQARRVGVTPSTVSRMIASGEIERVHAGVYRLTGLAWTWHTRQRGAALAVGDRGCISHAGAARWLDLGGVPVGRPEVTVSVQGFPRLAGVRVHRSRNLPPEDVTEVHGARCTTGSRTCIDLAGRLTRVRRIDLVDRAICAGIAERARLHARAVALERGRPGVGTIIEVTRPGADGEFWSALERAFGDGVKRCGLPEPAYNRRLRHAGRLYIPDALWEPQQLIVELKGVRFHSTPEQRGHDDERLNAFTELGYRMLVFGWVAVTERFDEVAARIAAVLGGAHSSR